jgi:peptide deformylase
MAILKIARMGHPVLTVRAEEVPDPTSREVRRLVDDMIETMNEDNGAGLAAPQIHVPRRIIIFRAPPERAGERAGADGEDTDVSALVVLINPELEAVGEEVMEGFEACLSVPGLTGLVRRLAHIRYRGLAPDGRMIEAEATGFHARVVQHENDHLDGILYPMRMHDLRLFGFDDEMRRRLKEPETQAPGEADQEDAAPKEAASSEAGA